MQNLWCVACTSSSQTETSERVKNGLLLLISEIFHLKCKVLVFLARLSTDEIKQRISGLRILPQLTGSGESASAETSARFVDQMYKKVYPLISGMDHDRLIYFYSLLADCENVSENSAQNHVRLLKKLKSTAAGNGSHCYQHCHYDHHHHYHHHSCVSLLAIDAELISRNHSKTSNPH